MKVGILGQGASGLFLALMLKFENQDLDVVVIDKNVNIGRKFLATGNGRCNLANTEITESSYNNEEGRKIVEEFDSEELISFLRNIGVLTRKVNNLVYPYSLSAKNLLDYLIDYAKQNKIRFVNNENLIDYDIVDGKVKVTTSKKNFSFDKFVIASGNGSAPQLGGATSVLSVLSKKGYKIIEGKPGLCPIRTVESTKTLENQRVKAKVTLVIDKNIAYEEVGEVQFKKDGLSGIAIFNCASVIARSTKFKKAIIRIDLMPDTSAEELFKEFTLLNPISNKSFLCGIFTKEVTEYIRKNSGVKNPYIYSPSELKKLALYIKNIEFTYKESYSFNDSQVTVGGINLKNVDENLESKLEKGIYFTGEVLNVDGLCGGYNLMFAFASAHKVANAILESLN